MTRFIQQQIPLTPTRSLPHTPCPVCGARSAIVPEVATVPAAATVPEAFTEGSPVAKVQQPTTSKKVTPKKNKK